MNNAKQLNDIQYLGTNATAIVTNNDRKKTKIKFIMLHNTDTTNDYRVKLYIVENGDTVDGSKQFANPEITATDTAFVEFPKPGLVLDKNNISLYAKAGVADKVTIVCYGETE